MSLPVGKRIIYDFGANNGDDIPYYLKKSDTVVAVEANPALTDRITQRFHDAVTSGKLIIVNSVLTVELDPRNTIFYLHRSNHVLSQLPRPPDSDMHDFDEVSLPSVNAVSLIRNYGAPFYVKIDVEHYDQKILRALFENNIYPPFISSECHSAEIFSLMLALGKYKSFNLVNGPSIPSDYRDTAIKTLDGEETYSFPHHSAGPFGDDIKSAWMTPDNFLYLLAFEGLGWKDVHATNLIDPDPALRPTLKSYLLRALRAKLLSVAGLTGARKKITTR